ncbi:hypothetical protein [Patiriisocius sp. Uisw_017]|jgi:hypothetical protein|uniref:hypothetical protein n=1 Tax=Patiriisocius sp. Uisw_017 TaxID=3230968 RepID=UPI0039EACC97
MKNMFILLILLSVFNACKEKRTTEENNESLEIEKNKVFTTAETIAYKNGFENWKDVELINFTFNVARNGQSNGGRAWAWKPKTNDITMTTAKDTVRFNRNALDSISKQYDAAFINDKFWLLAPYNLVWDEGTKISEKENQIAPMSKDTLNMLTLTYGDEGGYTPGDAYDFYYGKDFMLKEWVFRKGNAPEASMTTTWEDYEDFNGIKIAKMHKGQGGLELFFTNISVH